MKIEIAQRLRPFSHRPGTYAHIPGTTLRLQAFPTRIVVDDLSTNVAVQKFTFDFPLTGPVEEFTVQQDLENGQISVWGRSKEGFFRFRIRALASCEGIALVVEKLPDGCKVSHTGWAPNSTTEVRAGESYIFSQGKAANTDLYAVAPVERLSLGSHKQQEWEQICRREDFSEILPLWHRLGQLIPLPHLGSSCIASRCEQSIASEDAKGVLPAFRELFLACFDGIMAPRFSDPYHLGIDLPKLSPNDAGTTPLAILSQGVTLIRSIFVQVKGDAVALLPVVPQEFHAGRFLAVPCGNWGNLSLEWSKKAVRRVSLTAHKDTIITLKGCRDQKSCRLRLSTKDRGRTYELGSPFPLNSGQTYWLDNFQK